MDIRLTTCFAALAIALCACQSAPAPEKVSGAPAVESARPTAQAQGKMAALPFRLDLTFSTDAAGAISESGVPVTVRATYYGMPKAGIFPSEPLGLILNEEVYTAEGRNGAVRVRGAFDLDLATAMTQGDPRVQVSVSAAPGTGVDTLVCDIFDEALTLAVETGGVVHCELVAE